MDGRRIPAEFDLKDPIYPTRVSKQFLHKIKIRFFFLESRFSINLSLSSSNDLYVYFPQLRKDFLSGRRIPCDFHEMMALIAPRPLLERFALNDGDPRGQAHRVMLHLKVHEVYRLLGHEPAHAFVLFGDGHAIPDLSRASMLSWMDRWLKYDGDPLGAWDAHPRRGA